MNIFEKIKNFFKKLFACEPEAVYDISQVEDKEKKEEEAILFTYYTLDAAMGVYIEYCEGNKSASTIKCYKNFWKNYYAGIRNIEICHLTPNAVQKEIDKELQAGKSEATVKKSLYFLKAVVQFAYDNGMTDKRIDLCEVKVKAASD